MWAHLVSLGVLRGRHGTLLGPEVWLPGPCSALVMGWGREISSPKAYYVPSFTYTISFNHREHLRAVVGVSLRGEVGWLAQARSARQGHSQHVASGLANS